MAEKTDVYLITGFLGSGKTTFLNRIVETFQGKRRLAILMNEFGEIGIDGCLIEGKDFDLLEINRGSIFCVCVKTDFIRALHGIAFRIRPDLLIMESAGVADPTGLKRDLKLTVFQDRFRLVEQFCILDGTHFEEAYDVFAAVEKQIASSTVFVINKKDLASPEQIRRVKEIVGRIHPAPRFIETTYGQVPLEEFFPGKETLSAGETAKRTDGPSPDLEKIIDEILSCPTVDLIPPDRLLSAVYAWNGAAEELQHLLDCFPRDLVRGKGFVGDPEEVFLFDLVMGRGELKRASLPENRSGLINRIVFIGSAGAMKGLEALSVENPLLSKISVLDPMAGINK